MADLGGSQIYHKNVPPKARQLPAERFDVLLILGVFEWGPINTATTCIDYSDFYRTYGRYLAGYEGPIQVKQYFDGGGRLVVVNRVAHLTDYLSGTTLATAVKATKNFSAGGVAPYNGITLQVDGLYYGTRGNDLRIVIQNATRDPAGTTEYFDLLVYLSGETVPEEWYRNLSMDTTNDRYVEDVINTESSRSAWIAVTDLTAVGTATQRRPVNIALTALLGGNDGLTALAATDYTGNATYRTGMHAFTSVEDGDILICPDRAAVTADQNSLTTYCEVTRGGKVMFIVDPPLAADRTAAVAHATALTASEFRSAVYWPRVKVANPDKTIYGKDDNITICPSGSIAGRMALNAQQQPEGQFSQPGNSIYGLLTGVTSLEGAIGTRHEVLEPTVRDYVTPHLINPIVEGNRPSDGNWGVWLNDVQGGKYANANFRTVGEIHGVSYLRKQFERLLEQHRTQGNTVDRRRDIAEVFEAELMKWTERGAFATRDVSTAFYVNTDPDGEGLNNALVQAQQTMNVLVAIATADPARFMYLMFTKDKRAVDSYIQQKLAQGK